MLAYHIAAWSGAFEQQARFVAIRAHGLPEARVLK